MAITKLGQGPFGVIGFVTPDGFFEGHEAYAENETFSDRMFDCDNWRCDCCGSRLTWPCVLDAPTQGSNVFYMVGQTCAGRAEKGIDLHALAHAKHKAVRLQRDKYLADESFKSWCQGQPHPKGWENKTRYDDVRYWVMRKLPKMAVLRKAWREHKEAVDQGLVSPDGIQHNDEWKALAAFHGEHKAALSKVKHPMSSKRGFGKKKMADYVEYMLDAKATVPSALERALIIAKHSLDMGPSYESIMAERQAKAEAEAKAARLVEEKNVETRLPRWQPFIKALVETPGKDHDQIFMTVINMILDGSLRHGDVRREVRDLVKPLGLSIRKCDGCQTIYADADEREECEYSHF